MYWTVTSTLLPDPVVPASAGAIRRERIKAVPSAKGFFPLSESLSLRHPTRRSRLTEHAIVTFQSSASISVASNPAAMLLAWMKTLS